MCPLLAQLIVGFFSLFMLQPFTVLMKKMCAVKQSIFLDVYGTGPYCLPRMQEIVVPMATANIMVPHALPKQS